MTRDEFDALYQQGPDTVFALFERLFARVQALEEQAAKNSSNSSKPPSSDGLNKPPLQPMQLKTQSLRKKTGRKPGGQKGHAGATLQQVAKPDETVLHHPIACEHCEASLDGSPVVSVTKRQVFDIPPPALVVTEHQVATVRCPCCGKLTQANAPAGVEQAVQYGPNILAMATYLHVVHLVPCKRTAQIIQDLTGAAFSAGTLSRAVRDGFNRLAGFDQELQEALISVPVKHVDETGCRVKGKLHWLHVRCTKRLCRVFHHEKRGSIATADLVAYLGTLVSDFFSSYVSLPCTHVFCGAHLLRELKFIHEVLRQAWAGHLFAVLQRLVHECDRARDRGLTRVPRSRQLAREFDYWVKEGLKANPPPSTGKGPSSKARCLAVRLSEKRDDYLRFLFDLTLPFTNNEAEQAVRMFKVKEKISGCFRTDAGADMFCRIRSYTATCQRQDMSLLDSLQSVFAGQPRLPSLTPA